MRLLAEKNLAFECREAISSFVLSIVTGNHVVVSHCEITVPKRAARRPVGSPSCVEAAPWRIDFISDRNRRSRLRTERSRRTAFVGFLAILGCVHTHQGQCGLRYPYRHCQHSRLSVDTTMLAPGDIAMPPEEWHTAARPLLLDFWLYWAAFGTLIRASTGCDIHIDTVSTAN